MNCTEAGKLGAIARNKKLSAKRRKEISIAANKVKALKRKALMKEEKITKEKADKIFTCKICRKQCKSIANRICLECASK